MLDHNHARRVSKLSMSLARQLGLSEHEIHLIGQGALYHDIGKIAIPTYLLQSKEKFNEEEYRLMQRHVEYGLSILSVHTGEEIEVAREIIASHHERWDGQGYPRGLMSEAIPLYGRIVAVCDVFDALCSDRPYKAAWPVGKALDYIKDQSGEVFDPRVVEAFLQMMAEGVAV
ncbi:HD-GYP domain-containing protein [Paenibacillus sp. PDC88]|uniref:HD-GYP domain-containing protein n=1 Tax=Paenibacillus sp. PDC88 TaxID=1884375 RepID=UPI00210B1AD8|nr:HD-GYP domain-containing protein [Paenibacillus sp. PDC88]